ncbi:hypothetical protein D3C77_575550 [compost metagenome]
MHREYCASYERNVQPDAGTQSDHSHGIHAAQLVQANDTPPAWHEQGQSLEDRHISGYQAA